MIFTQKLLVHCTFIIFMFFPASIWGQVKIINISKDIKFGHRDGKRTTDSIDVIIIHSNYYVGKNPFSTKGCIEQFKKYDVASHYLITKEGDIIQLVDENNVAWHAGVSRIPNTNRNNINTCSIGIEIINTKTTGPSIKQYAALILLTKDICSRYNIQYILGHKDIAPNRKDDPWLFDWDMFYKEINWNNK